MSYLSVLSKAVIDRTEFSSGCHKLPLGKVDPRLLRISINNPVADGFALHDCLWGTGKQVLYPSQDNLGFINTQTTVKDLQWFVRNPTSTIETNPLVIYEDSATWNVAQWGTGTYSFQILDETTTVYSGSKSKKFAYNGDGSYANVEFQVLTSNLNISSYDIISFAWYGINSGLNFILMIRSSGGYRYWQFTDNFTGWRRLTFHIANPYNNVGVDLTAITSFGVQATGYVGDIHYFDHLIVDVCPSIPVKKLGIYGLYLENQLEESPTPSDVLEIIDDSQSAFWVANEWGSGSCAVPTLSDETTIKVKGADSLKMVCNAGASQYWRIMHTYGSYQNWTGYDFLVFYLYGSNTGFSFYVRITTGNETPYYTIQLVENWSGWKRIIIPFAAMTQVNSPNITQVKSIYYWNSANGGGSSSPSTGTIYLDRMVLMKGRWAFVEVAVPDSLYIYYNYLTASASTIDWSYWVLSAWNGSSWVLMVTYETGTSSNKFMRSDYPLLNGTTMHDVYGEPYASSSSYAGTMFPSGIRGDSKTKNLNSIYMATNTINYNGVGGCKRRIGFALKMPPADGLASSTTGISQVKIKLEVYVP